MTPSETDALAERLWELLGKATPGPYDFMEGQDIIRAIRGDLAVPLFDVRTPFGDPDMKAPTVMHAGKVMFRANSQAARDSASIKQARHNGLYLITLLKSVPTLLTERAEMRARIAALEAENERLREAGQEVLDRAMPYYRSRNGRNVYIQCDDGERAEIVHSEGMYLLRQALGSGAGDA